MQLDTDVNGDSEAMRLHEDFTHGHFGVVETLPVHSGINIERPFLGCDDPRVNIITNQLVTPTEAQDLVSL